MITCYAISDLHGNLPLIPPCDLLVLGGDYCPGMSRDPLKQRDWVNETFSPWLRQIPARQIVGIAGNHDFVFQYDPDFARSLPWKYLLDEAYEFETIRIYGTPWTPLYGNWAFMASEKDLAGLFEHIPNGLDILLSHGPAYRHLDKNQAGVHCGSIYLWQKIQQTRPFNVVSGHIHEGRGIMQDECSRYYNVTYTDRNNSAKYNPMYIHINPEPNES